MAKPKPLSANQLITILSERNRRLYSATDRKKKVAIFYVLMPAYTLVPTPIASRLIAKGVLVDVGTAQWELSKDWRS